MDVIIDGRTWTIDLDNKIGGGSFGAVYAAARDGQEGAVKLVPKDRGAQRELLVVEGLRDVPNVVPVHGVGEADGSWAIAMPRAEQSLRAFLRTVGGPLDPALALPILLDIAQALVSLKSKGVVHRDLKPENILLLDGHWCIADFGIARYAEAATSSDTWKLSKTAVYAAPEQWREERATSATDVYAFGIIAYEIVTGELPFPGPNFREQHLSGKPPKLSSTLDTPLRSIIDECLVKAPQARPTPERLLARLQAHTAAEAPSGGAAALMEAHHAEVQRVSEAARRASAAATESKRRAELLDVAGEDFLRIENKIVSVIRANAPLANEGGWPIRLGYARLDLAAPTRTTSVGRIPLDVIAHTEIRVDQANAPSGHTSVAPTRSGTAMPGSLGSTRGSRRPSWRTRSSAIGTASAPTSRASPSPPTRGTRWHSRRSGPAWAPTKLPGPSPRWSTRRWTSSSTDG